MNIIPGEPVPPGFEDEVNRVAEIQQAIDQYKGNALIGLEYTVELYEEDRCEPGYMCVLCDKRGDPRTIMQHWTSFNHRLKYLEKHYPSAVREFNPVKYKPNSHNILILIVQSLAEAIEDHHGRLTLSVYSADDFRRMKTKITSEINGKFHFDERNGPNFLNVIDRSLWEGQPAPKKMEQTLQITIKAPKRSGNDVPPGCEATRDELDEISSDSDGQSEMKRIKRSEQQQTPAYRALPRVRRSPPFEEDRAKETDKKLPTPKELSLQASHIAQERYKWEKYRCMLEIQLNQMEGIQKDYEKNPEKHPLYPEEWKKFWNRRYKELQAEKKTDPNKYDYKPEWIVYWTKRMKDLFNSEVEKKKKEIKLKLGLPEDAEEKVDQLKEKYKVQVSRNAAGAIGMQSMSAKLIERVRNSPAKLRSRDREITTDVIDISDDEDHRSHSRSRSRRTRSRSNSPRVRRKHSRSRSPRSEHEHERPYHRHRGAPAHSRAYPPVEADYYGSRSRYPVPAPHYSTHGHYRVMDSHLYPKYEHSPSPNSRPGVVKEEPEPEDEGPLTVVAVLRLLTALEEHLGSLGPKVVDLLGKSLSLEKIKANSSDDMLMNDDHCVFFETIKEKLKGLLIADVLEDPQKVRAVKKAIKNIAAIIHQVTTKGQQEDAKDENAADGKNDGETNKKRKLAANGPNIKDLPFDRQIIATKLAAALVMQGREDVSTADMDKLIFLFVLMVKLSKRKLEIDGKSMHVGDILPELGIAAPISTAPLLAALPGIVDELFEKEVNALVHEVEEEISNDTSDKDSKNDASSNMLESLTDSDLQTLLQNFKHLSTEEQHHLIAHLKKLETADAARVEKLRKFVNLADFPDVASTSGASTSNKAKMQNDKAANTMNKNAHSKRYDDSPAAPGTVKDIDIYSDDESDRRHVSSVSNPNKFSLDDEDEDDDYNFEDVFKAASSNVNRLSEESTRSKPKYDTKISADERSNSRASNSRAEPIVPVSSSPSALTFNPAGLNISLSDTQNLIANLMGSLQQSNSNQNASNKGATSNGGQSAPTIATQQQHQQNTNAAAYYLQNQQQQQQSHGQSSFGGAGYNQMGGPPAAYYNAMGGYGNAAAGYAGGYQQWSNGAQQMPNMQPYGMPGYMPPPQQQQQQMDYNMYGGRGGN